MPDLVIGRRAGVAKPWRVFVIAIAMLTVMVIVGRYIYQRSVAYDIPPGTVSGEVASSATATGALPALVYGDATPEGDVPVPSRPAEPSDSPHRASASLTWLGGIAVLRVAGEPHAIGAAHGRLLAPWLPAIVAAYAPSISGTVSDDGMFGGMTHGVRLGWRWRFIDDGLAEPDRLLVAGLVRGAAASGAALDHDELLRDQVVLDVGAPSPRSDGADQHVIAHSLTVIGAQAQVSTRVWIGRTLALPGLDDGGDAALPVVTIAKPAGRIAWAGVGWPGQLGAVTGINAEGIAVIVAPARTSDIRLRRTARPIALLARTVLEQATTLDEAVKLIEGSPTLGSALYAVVDGASGKWVQIERTPSKAIIERNPKSPVLGDVFTSNALSSDPVNDRAERMLPTPRRVERAARLVRAPLVDVAAMAAILRDQRGTDDAVRPRGHRAVIDDGRAVQTVIIDPGSLALWVADPASGGRLRALDLRHELRNEGDRAMPPADIAEPTSDGERTGGLPAARADLRNARAALRRGDRERAAEHCARARARAPTLPEAIELEAIIAQARGDQARARAAFQTWLDGGPDDPQGEERARAALAR